MRQMMLLMGVLLAVPTWADDYRMSDKVAQSVLENPKDAGYVSPLTAVLTSARPKYAAIAWERLQTMEWRYDEYRAILYDPNSPYAASAWQRLQGDRQANPVKEQNLLAGLFQMLPRPSPYREPIFQRFWAMDISNQRLAHFVHWAPDPYEERFYRRLLAQNPSVPELYGVNHGWEWNSFIDEMRKELWEQRELTPIELAWLAGRTAPNHKADREKAWERLIALGMPHEALILIINGNGFYRDQAWDMLRIRPLVPTEVRDLIHNDELPEPFRLKVAKAYLSNIR